MKTIDLKAFRKVNDISQVELAEYLGVGQSFISQIEKGTRPIPQEYISKILANENWDTSMVSYAYLHLLDGMRPHHEAPHSIVQSAIKEALNPEEKFLIGYLERKVKDQDVLIRELYKQIGMLEAELSLARKGEIASIAVGSSDVDAV